MDFERVKTTPMALIAYELGPSRLCQAALNSALEQVRRRGFVAPAFPILENYRQHIVLVRATDPIAALYRAIDPDGSPTPLPRGLVESRTQLPLNNFSCGMMLAQYGLCMIRVVGCCVIMRGTTTELAQVGNISRYMKLSAKPTWTLIESATSVVKPPSEIDDDLRLRAAEIFHAHAVEIEGLLDGEDSCTPISHWRFPEACAKSDELTPPF